MFLGNTAVAENQCRVCLQEKLQGAKAKTVAGAALGALGGAKAGAIGAACGAIIGAVGANVNILVELTTCEQKCLAEVNSSNDPSKKCEALLTAVKR